MLGQANLINPARIPFYLMASIVVINHVRMYLDAKNAGYHFTAQQKSLAPQKWWYNINTSS